MKSARWISKLALVCTLYSVATTSLAVMAGNVTFVRRSTGNWHQIGETDQIIGMATRLVNDAVDADIPDGLPSVIAPLTADGEDSFSDDTRSAEILYTGELAGTYDHQGVIDHSMESTFTSILELTIVDINSNGGIGGFCPHDEDAVCGSLDVSIDGDGIQFIDVSLEMDWQAAGLQSGDSGFMSYADFPFYGVTITVYRNGGPVIWIDGDHNGVSYLTMDGLTGPDGGTAYRDGDATFGNCTIGDHFGLWAADGDVIEYELHIDYVYDSGLGNINNFSDAEAGFTGNGLLNWRFALEDSHID
ncbi:MAG: hypothetical protein JWP89_2904 [Schlesneria sp.]|nr:hypothetical protein [Schlesneria sp.]